MSYPAIDVESAIENAVEWLEAAASHAGELIPHDMTEEEARGDDDLLEIIRFVNLVTGAANVLRNSVSRPIRNMAEQERGYLDHLSDLADAASY